MAISKVDLVIADLAGYPAEGMLERALANPDEWSHWRLATVLRLSGYDVSNRAIKRWRTAHGYDD